ncbi:Zn-ribbon domain-containing OB-fold protein [Rhodococcus jostii]|uniref:OB-fold domain-containing protein n=1 Tax=Rhodococcus jostii TaxID=132919 RepID=A0ABU4CRB1_RHOJO|nr:OB-fold domain-containing protein [Rhodococcus jostii]MDV6285993.1 OB-fold domain-containing protein [Rhodococcus jostii]
MEECDTAVFKPQAFCPSCWSTRLAWTESLGFGTIYSYSVVWRAQSPAFDTPYVVAIIELAEGFHMMSNIVNCDETTVHCGMPVTVTFRKMPEGMTLPFFEPSP